MVSFGEQKLIVLDVAGRKVFTAEAVGKALEYDDPGRSVSNLHKRNDKEFERGIDWDWFNTERHQIDDAGKSRYTTRIYYQTGVNLIGMLSDQPRAKDFRRWAKQVLASAWQPVQRSVANPAEDPKVAAAIMLAKLTTIAQLRPLDSLSDRDVLKYQYALTHTLLDS